MQNKNMSGSSLYTHFTEILNFLISFSYITDM